MTTLYLRRSRLVVFLSCAPLFLLAPTLSAQDLVKCSPQDYKILSESALAIECTHEVYPSGAALTVAGSGNSYSVGTTSITPMGTVTIRSLSAANNRWFLATLSGGESILKPKQKYRLIFGYSVTDAAGHSTRFDSVSLDVDTTETVTIAAGNVSSQPKLYEATSHVGFSLGGKQLALQQLEIVSPSPDLRTKLKVDDCHIALQDDTKRSAHVDGKCSTLGALVAPAAGTTDFTGVDPSLIGRYQVNLNDVPHSVLIPADLQLQDVFGGTPKIDAKSRFSPQKAPATKDASKYYIAFNYAAGVGTVPAWVLDGKISPQIFRDGVSFGPLLTASVGNNKLKGQTYTDTIDFGGSLQKLFQPNHALQELLLTLGPTYETDKEFDRHNLLATADLRYNFAGLYRTQSIGTLQNFYAALQQSEKNKSEYKPQLDDMKPVLYGYALDFHTGLEAGGAVVDTTVTASVGKATQSLPAYSIFRVVPQVHGLLEIWRFSFDETMVGRYLVATENTVVETASHSLLLKQLQGWKGISTLTAIYNWDAQGHFAINITFKDGFTPPTYQRVNAVQAGILLKY